MSFKATICGQAVSDTPAEIKKMISESFSGVSWRKEAVTNMTGDMGRCKFGNVVLQFGIFTKAGKTIEGIALEISGRFNNSALEAVCEFCDKIGLKLSTDNSFEEEVVEGADRGQAESASVLGAFCESESKVLACIG